MSDGFDVLRELLPLLERYQEQNADPEVPVVDHVDAESLRGKFDLSLPDRGIPLSDLVPRIESYLRYGVRTGHRRFLNQLYGGFDPAGFLGDLVGSLTNTSMYTYEVAPLATLMERELITRMNSFVGFPDGDGVFCTGGSNANMLGLLCARDRSFPEIRSHGFSGHERPAVFVSDQAHYSFFKAANLLGIGTERVIRVGTDERGRMVPGELERAIDASRRREETPLLVGATAGTTVLGAFDPIRDLAEISRREGLWLHVDGSWGGPVLMSATHRGLLDGCEQADSFSWDAHKIMGASLTCAAFLTRHAGALRRACSAGSGDVDYLFHEGRDTELDLGRKSLQCGRRVDALRLWLMWRQHGTAGLAAHIDRAFELAQYAAERIAETPNIELVAPLESLNVCFRYVPAGEQDADPINRALRERMLREGRTFFNFSHLRGKVALRVVFSNPLTDERDIREFLDDVARMGADLSARPMSAGRADT